MSCGKALEVDLRGFLAGAREPGLEEFRAHYPRCADCSAEVRAWTEVHRLLVEPGSGSFAEAAADAPHPPEALLLRFEDDPASLPAARRASVETHLASCRSCRDELSALREMDLSRLEAAAPDEAAPDEAVPLRPAPGRVPRLARLRAVALHPAFAYAIVLLLLYPAVKGVLDRPAGVPVLDQPPGVPATRAPQEALQRSAPEAAGDVRSSKPHVAAPATPRPAAPRPAAPLPEPAPPAPAPAEPARRAGEAAASRREDAAASRREEQAARNTAERRGESALAGQRPAAAPAGAASPQVVVLRHGEPVELSRSAVAEALTVRVVVPDAVRDAQRLEVRVLAPEGTRELRERFGPWPTPPHLDVALPADWLSPGTYRVELATAEAGSSVTRVFEFSLVVSR